MRADTVQHLRRAVRESYDYVAVHWDKTRQHLWGEFGFLLPYLKSGSRVLDAGCGNGRLAGAMPEGVEYTGFDNSAELLKCAHQNFPDKKFMAGDILELPFPDNSFDVLASVAVWHHLPSRKLRSQAADESARVLASGGILFLLVWNMDQPKYRKYFRQNFWRKIFFRSRLDFGDAYVPFGEEKVARYVHRFRLPELEKLLAKDFIIKRIGYTHHGEILLTPKGAHNLMVIAQKK